MGRSDPPRPVGGGLSGGGAKAIEDPGVDELVRDGLGDSSRADAKYERITNRGS